MKNKLLILLAFLCLSIPAHAQWCIGGSVNFKHSGMNRSSSLTLKPDISYGFGHVSVGATLLFDLYTFYGEDRSDLSFGVNPYVQYYFWSSGNLSLYAEGGVDLTRNIFPDNTYNRAEFYLCPGIEYSLTDHWALMGTLGRLEYDTYTRAFALGLDAANFSFGVYYSF